MATSLSASAATAGPSIAEMAQERLEKLQIRREHQALLEKISNIGAQRDKDLEDIRQQYEAALESNKETLTKIEDLETKISVRDREVDEFVNDLQRFKATVEEFLRIRASEEETEEVMSAATAGRPSSSFIREKEPEDKPRSSIEVPAPSKPTRPTRRAANRKSSYVPRECNLPHSRSEAVNQDVAESFGKDTAANGGLRKSNLATETMLSSHSTNNRKRPTTTRPTEQEPARPHPLMTRQRSGSRPQELRNFAATTPAAPSPPKIPKLSQDRRPLGTYYKASSIIYASLRLDGGRPEFNFISSFISGISSKKEQNRLIDSLANFCFCDTKDDGTREILCTWDEVMDGLKAAKLVGDEDDGQDQRKGRPALVAADTALMSNPRAADNPFVKEQPAARGSRRGNIVEATDMPVGGRERRDVKKRAARLGRAGNGSESTGAGVVNKSDSGNAIFGAAIENLDPNKANFREPASKAKGKSNPRVAKRPAPKKGKAAAAASAVDLNDQDNRTAVGSGAQTTGITRGGRRGRQRAAKR
ncbi:hypothetical protein ONS95_008263 [Cadophora gregata]|uniref:uncharacterized protein n=1 Tax=Cadophora gregata TaxID=51156 RepID=UPI0026DA81AA|nr:uncharacterized protein ONS95_008263 [Cadophora gregata]KAK0100305.1 hypothetical protein ONS96_007586 [Cadophora gregata f. sp. sojae]KAK0126681.1 hypothetical protein ONS95_008263 [Cadophora gregata]